MARRTLDIPNWPDPDSFLSDEPLSPEDEVARFRQPDGTFPEWVKDKLIETGAKGKSKARKYCTFVDKHGHEHLNGLDPRLTYCVRVPRGSGKQWDYWYRSDTHKQVCGARLARLHRRCKRYKGLAANGRCYRHRGYSKHNPPAEALVNYARSNAKGALYNAKQRARADKDLLDLKPGIALFDEYMSEIAHRLDGDADSPVWRRECLKLFERMDKALAGGDTDAFERNKRDLGEKLGAGCERDRAWKDLLELQERRSLRAEKANDLLLKSTKVVAWHELMLVMERLVTILDEEVADGSRGRVLERLDREILALSPREAQAETGERRALLPGVPGARTPVRDGGAWGEAVGVPEGTDREPVPAPQGDGANMPRAREDANGVDGGAGVPGDTSGRDRDHDGAD